MVSSAFGCKRAVQVRRRAESTVAATGRRGSGYLRYVRSDHGLRFAEVVCGAASLVVCLRVGYASERKESQRTPGVRHASVQPCYCNVPNLATS